MVLLTSSVFLVLFKLRRRGEAFVTGVTGERFCSSVLHLLVSPEQTRRPKGSATLMTLQRLRGALVCFEILRVSVCLLAQITAEPLVFLKFRISDHRGLWLIGRFAFRCNKLSDGGNGRSGFETLWPQRGAV